MKLFASILIASALAAGSVSAQELWGGAAAGMTPAEAQAAIPGLLLIEPSDRGDAQARLEGITLRDRPWRALFTFPNDKLSLVSLRPANATAAEQRLLFSQTDTDLRAKYGQPLACERSNLTVLVIHSCEWAAGDLRVSLKGYEDDGFDFFVGYQSGRAAESIF